MSTKDAAKYWHKRDLPRGRTSTLRKAMKAARMHAGERGPTTKYLEFGRPGHQPTKRWPDTVRSLVRRAMQKLSRWINRPRKAETRRPAY